MKLRVLSLIAAVALASGPAFAQSVSETAKSVGESVKSAGEKTGVNEVLGVTPSTADFAHAVAISDLFEIQSSELAEKRADAATKKFAEEMITAHRKTSAELKGLVSNGKVTETLPTKLDSAHQQKLDSLAKLHGADFIKQYRADQVDAHEDAVSLFERYATGGDNPALKDWAGKTLPHLKHHLQMAEQLPK